MSASVACVTDDPDVSTVSLSAFGDTDDLRSYWDAELESLEPSLEESETACEPAADGEAEPVIGVRRWGFGSLACSVEDGRATIRWFDRRSRNYGRIQASTDDVAALYAWWQGNARALGRPLDGGSGPANDLEEVPPLVRVPSAPDDVTCAEVGEPILDIWGRRWRATAIDFVERPRYERMVVNLERVTRNGNGAQVSVQRIPVSRLDEVRPGAPRPRRGRSVLVVTMDGVRNAPGLRGFRPDSLELINEVSVVQGRGSRTALIATPRNACYQVRVPVFGPSANGRERRAEIYIDVQQR